ncbi:MAG: hypothetical protein ACUVWX_13875 [Kiritimatiellia bacterium]
MTSKERVLAAVNHVETEQVPITFDAQQEVYEALYQHLGVRTKKELFDALHVDTWMILPRNYEIPEGEKSKTEKPSIWGYRKSRPTIPEAHTTKSVTSLSLARTA